jgi:nucleoid DNA-binding protein
MRIGIGLGVLVGGLVLLGGAAEPIVSQKKNPAKTTPVKTSLEGRIMAYSKLKDKETSKFLEALGPAVREMLTAGQQVDIPNLGVFRVVGVPAHRDMVQGRPVTMPAANHVEFIPSGELAATANGTDVVPAEVVVPFQYTPIPDRVPATKAPNSRMPNVRTR